MCDCCHQVMASPAGSVTSGASVRGLGGHSSLLSGETGSVGLGRLFGSPAPQAELGLSCILDADIESANGTHPEYVLLDSVGSGIWSPAVGGPCRQASSSEAGRTPAAEGGHTAVGISLPCAGPAVRVPGRRGVRPSRFSRRTVE